MTGATRAAGRLIRAPTPKGNWAMIRLLGSLLSVRSSIATFGVLVGVLWGFRLADVTLFEKGDLEFWAETAAAFCAVSIHLAVEKLVRAWKHTTRQFMAWWRATTASAGAGEEKNRAS